MNKPQGLQGWDNIRDCERKHREFLQCSPTQLSLALKHTARQRGETTNLQKQATCQGV